MTGPQGHYNVKILFHKNLPFPLELDVSAALLIKLSSASSLSPFLQLLCHV